MSQLFLDPETPFRTPLQKQVFLDRYARKDAQGMPVEHHPAEMWRRVAEAIAVVEPTAEKRMFWTEQFHRALRDFRFVPGGRILAGAGTGHEVTLFNCFVIPSPEDSRGGILDNLKLMTEIMARGGGVGINLSTLRPRGSHIHTVNGTASGPCSWAQLYSVATGDVIQQGGSRRGALMLMLDDTHPDIEEFVTAKCHPGVLEHANLSVCVSDALMEAIVADADWPLVWDGKVHKTLRARDLWNLIGESAWASAEPGVVFMDRYNRESNTWYYETIHCVNPCGEEGLPAFGVCNLGALNLATFIHDRTFDFGALAEHTRIALRFLDDVIDATPYFLPENRRAQVATRRTGLGTMGLADALLTLGLRYGHDESLALIEQIYTTIRDAAYDASCDLATEKGSFPKFDRERYLQGPFIQRLPTPLQSKIREHGIRNAVLLCQAPSGTTSLLAGVSSGIEPVFDFAMVRRDRLGEHVVYHPLYQAWCQNFSDAVLPSYFVRAGDLTPEEHVRVQALVQRYTDASISKTVNAPSTHTVAQVASLYRLAYELGCKGITYYRDGSRDAVLHHVNPQAPTNDRHQASQAGMDDRARLRVRPPLLAGATYRAPTPVGTAFVTINHADNGSIAEVFVTVGRAGSDVAADAEALGRLISLVFRIPSLLPSHQVAEGVIDQLRGIGGSSLLGLGSDRVRSLADAVAKVLAQDLSAAKASEIETVAQRDPYDGGQTGAGTGHEIMSGRSGDFCPSCGQIALVYEEGCRKCYACGFSSC